MSYRCQVCKAKVPPRQSLRRYVTYRILRDFSGHERTEISSETPCCEKCLQALQAGVPMRDLQRDVERYTTPQLLAPVATKQSPQPAPIFGRPAKRL